MKMKTRDFAIGLAALVLIALAGWLWLAPAGNTAPNVRMTLLDGKTIDLHALRGHPVLINFWATSCPGCVAEIPHLAQLYNKLSPQGFEIIGVAMSYDVPSQVRTMQRDRHIPYPITIDRTDAISKAFGTIRLTPTSFLIDPQGRVVYQKIGNVNIDKLAARVKRMLPKQGNS
ncbi:TlpA disulfide reductase family protein [Acidihalobacter yilgarnensis]|nr:TlpA disulfide reductase family protein [Acidihalobacter yilgarnensis]